MGECFFKFSGLRRFRLVIMLAVAGLLYSSCLSENKSEKTAHAVVNKPLADTITYEMAHFKDFSPYLSGTDSVVDSTIFSARYPVFAEEINTLVKNAIFVDGEETAAQVSESFLGGFNEYAEEQIDAGNGALHAWYKHQEVHVVFNGNGFLTLRNAISDYTGGAHGMEVELWFNYDLSEKKLLTLADLVQDKEALTAVVERYFKKQENLPDTASYGPSYFFEDNHFTLAENFGLTSTGLLFHYNPYEIKSYAEGPTTLLIPYPEISETFTDKGKRLLAEITEKN